MTLNRYVLIAFRNLVKSRGRTLFIGGAIAIVSAILVVLLSMTSGIERTLLFGAKTMASGDLNIAGFYKISQSSSAPMINKRQMLEDFARANVPEAELIIDRVKAYGKIISESESIQVPMWGVDMKREGKVIGKLALARVAEYATSPEAAAKAAKELEGNIQDLGQRNAIALFATHAKKLAVRVGDQVTLSMPTSRNVNNTLDVRVVAILRDVGMMSSYTVFVNADDIRQVYQIGSDVTGQIMIFLKDGANQRAVEDRLRKLAPEKTGFPLMEKEANPYWMKMDRVSGESWTGQKLDITTWQDETAFVKWVIDLIKAVTFILTTILMGLVVLGLINSIWTAIRERTGEIGTLRAIGMQRRSVLVMFVIEALILAAAASAVGILAGVMISSGLNLLEIPIESDAFRMFLMANTLTLSIEQGNLLLAFGMITFFVTVGALYPCYKATKLRPITAMNKIE